MHHRMGFVAAGKRVCAADLWEVRIPSMGGSQEEGAQPTERAGALWTVERGVRGGPKVTGRNSRRNEGRKIKASLSITLKVRTRRLCWMRGAAAASVTWLERQDRSMILAAEAGYIVMRESRCESRKRERRRLL